MAGMMAAIGVPIAAAGTVVNAKGIEERKSKSKGELKKAKLAVTKYGEQSKQLAQFGQDEGAAVETDHQQMLDAFTGTMPGDPQMEAAQTARTNELNAGAVDPAFAGAETGGSSYADRFTKALMADRIARAEAATAPLGYAAAQGDQQLAEQKARDDFGEGELARGGRIANAANLGEVTDASNRAPVADIMGALPGRMAFAQRKGFWSRAGGSAAQEFGIGMAKSEGGGGFGNGGSNWWSKFTGGGSGGGQIGGNVGATDLGGGSAAGPTYT